MPPALNPLGYQCLLRDEFGNREGFNTRVKRPFFVQSIVPLYERSNRGEL